MMRPYIMIFLRKIYPLLCVVLLNGCVIKHVGTTVEHTFKGDYYLTSEKFEQGRESFAREVDENPDSALAHYYYGRFLLQDNDFELALTHLKNARDLDPRKPDYHFWTGVAYGGLKDIENEEASYAKALILDEDHLQSLIYLGHVKLRGKRYDQALELYSRALEIWPGSPSALYNRALILHILNRTPEARLAWLDYLELYPSGPKGRRAADYLNMTGDFNFRNQTLGNTIVTVEKIRFVPFTAELAEASNESLFLIGEVFQDMANGVLQIVVYQKNNKELAKERAIAIKQFLLSEFPSFETKQIGVSWFAEPQKISIRNKKLSLDEGVSFFVTL